MSFMITWKGVAVRNGILNNVDGSEKVEAASAISAVHAARNAILEKLQDSTGYALLNITVKNQAGPTKLNLKEVYTFIGSFNAEGGLVKGSMNIPTQFKVTTTSSKELHWQGRSVIDGEERVITGLQKVQGNSLLGALKESKPAIVAELSKGNATFALDHIIVKNVNTSCRTNEIYDFFADLNNEGGLELTADDGPKWVSFDSKSVKGQTKIFLPK